MNVSTITITTVLRSEPRESPHLHPHGEVLPLHETGADVARLRVSKHDLVEDAHDAGWVIGPGPIFGWHQSQLTEPPEPSSSTIQHRKLQQFRQVNHERKTMCDGFRPCARQYCRYREA